MPTTVKLHRHAPRPASSHPAAPALRHKDARTHLSTLKAQADDSLSVMQLEAMQQQADAVLQRNEEDEASEPMTLIASMEGDKIGSIYIGSGRIRTTHASGPVAETHEDRETVRFHIDRKAARIAFEKAVPDYNDAKKHPKGPVKSRMRWIGRTLAGADPEALPPWATLIGSVDAAFDSANAPGAAGKQLFEVFYKAGVYSGYHPSRGVAVKFETDSATMDALRAAASKVAKIKDPKAKNETFYAELVKSAPEFAAKIRKPEDIQT